jgi:hypothetical protein
MIVGRQSSPLLAIGINTTSGALEIRAGKVSVASAVTALI